MPRCRECFAALSDGFDLAVASESPQRGSNEDSGLIRPALSKPQPAHLSLSTHAYGLGSTPVKSGQWVCGLDGRAVPSRGSDPSWTVTQEVSESCPTGVPSRAPRIGRSQLRSVGRLGFESMRVAACPCQWQGCPERKHLNSCTMDACRMDGECWGGQWNEKT
jgi:hypothetical protein